MKITDEELLIDIRNTEREVEAYRMIKEGYRILSVLPENEDSHVYSINLLRFEQAEDGCREFLKKLYKIKSERNLE